MSEPRRRILLLGGSFNPAHEGHVHISLHALKALKAAEVWWIVSPHNPLKEKDSLADYEQRYHHAEQLIIGLPIVASRFEEEHGLQYSHATIAALQKTHPDIEFIWLMGSDNLAGFHRWKHWQDITHMVPIAVYDREGYREAAEKSEAALYLAPHKCALDEVSHQPFTLPSFVPLPLEMHPLSATKLRKELGKAAFFPHNKES